MVVRARTRDDVLARCTGCGIASGWVHSRYVRRLADHAIGGRPVRIELNVRRLYCENSVCAKATFGEQVEGLTVVGGDGRDSACRARRCPAPGAAERATVAHQRAVPADEGALCRPS
ncbi:transposase family protein [Streptomyces sp. 3213.3]|uniref:transposase family protein n=1 Tax=Streptomyces sp. 3213.3 TaxID=1855348 RepID=UPI000B872814|nr:transposase family protein [Streptomyces sp. 3213.3]